MNVAIEIVRLRQRITDLEREFASLVPADEDPSTGGQLRIPGNASSSPANPVPPSHETIEDVTLISRILDVLEARPEQSFSPNQIIAQLKNVPGQSVRGTLTRLLRAGKIRRLGRGLYQAATGKGG